MEAMFKQGYIRKECEYGSVVDQKDADKWSWFNLPLKIQQHISSTAISTKQTVDHIFQTNVPWLAGVQHYNEIKGNSICEFLPPHLVIYVDLPAEEVQKKLKESGKVGRHTH